MQHIIERPACGGRDIRLVIRLHRLAEHIQHQILAA